jgi:hypothetical protein
MLHSLLLNLLCVARLVAPSAPVAVINLHSQAVVTSAEVTLAQVADLQAPAEMLGPLGQVSLGSAPIPGATRTLAADYIRFRLRRHSFDPDRMRISGTTVTLRREATASVSSPTDTPVTAPLPQPLLAHRGELVEVEVQCGGVTIRTAGRIMSDGRAGELVNVQVDKTNHTLQARVSGPGRLLCVLSGDEL